MLLGHPKNTVSSITPNPQIAGIEDGLGFASGLAAGRASESTSLSGTAEPDGVQPQVSTTKGVWSVGAQNARANNGREPRSRAGFSLPQPAGQHAL